MTQTPASSPLALGIGSRSAYCTDMHWTDARKAGVDDRKLVRTACWRESPGEQAALAWVEAVTGLSRGHVPDAEFESAT